MQTQLRPKPKPSEPGGNRRVLSTRRGTIMVASIAALAALALLLVFLANYRDSVDSSETLTVLVADRQIDEGTSGDVIAEHQLFDTSEITENEEVDGAFEDVSDLKGQVATTTIYPGEQLGSDAFSDDADPVAGRLEGTDRALAIPVDESHGNIDQIEDGSRVDVLGGVSAQISGGTATAAISFLARDALVLKVIESDSGASSDSGGGNTVVIRVSDLQAARIARASDDGDVWLAIRPPTLAKESPAETGIATP
jgi:Flp pilus assembly protein CpaB